jgi:hypothetical protein
MRALDIAERITPEIMQKIDEILDNKPEQEPNERD